MSDRTPGIDKAATKRRAAEERERIAAVRRDAAAERDRKIAEGRR